MAVVILVVEYEAAIRILIRKILEQHGYKVYSAEDSQEALAILEVLDRQVDLILADLNVPTVDGKALDQHIGELAANVRVAYMTAKPPEWREHWPKSATILSKPFHPMELLAHIKQALAVSR